MRVRNRSGHVRPVGREVSAGRAWTTLGLASLVAFAGAVDNFGFAVAAPRAAVVLAGHGHRGAFAVSAITVTWLLEGFGLALASWLVVGGQLGDRFGRKLLTAVGLVLFGGASAVAARAGSAGELIVARYAMGAGGVHSCRRGSPSGPRVGAARDRAAARTRASDAPARCLPDARPLAPARAPHDRRPPPDSRCGPAQGARRSLRTRPRARDAR
jgi:hypothetical protein